MKKCLIFLLLMICVASVNAQDDIKIMSYNVLIYPEGSMANRIDTLSKILNFYQPDLLLLQELKSEQGLQDITEELNLLFGNYSSGTYVPQISNPANSWRLQQNLIYNELVFELVGEEVIETPYRDINYYQLEIIADDTTTELLHTYVTHLKSSQGSDNEQLRFVMAEVLMDHVSLLPPESNVVVAGDFNVYHGEEPAYELLLSANGTNSLQDPINLPGWANADFTNNEVYTQSTRLESLADGSGGGMDDRFDFVLLSDRLMSTAANYSYQQESYRALGNNGTCYNQDLIDCSATDNVPFDILRSLYYMSDHLPIVLSLKRVEVVSALDPLMLDAQKIEIAPNPAVEEIDILWEGANSVEIRIFNSQGSLMMERELFQDHPSLDVTSLPTGLYVVQTREKNNGVVSVKKLLIQR